LNFPIRYLIFVGSK